MNFTSLKREIDRLRILNWLHTIVPTMGNVYYVFNTSDTYYTEADRLLNQTYYDNTQAVHTSIESAYAACTSGRNDVILIDWNSTHTLTAMLTTSKNRVHFVWMDGWWRKNSQWSKIGTPATDVAASIAVIKNTGTRNTFVNLKIIQSGLNVAQTSWLIDEWEGTYVKNCSFEVNWILSTVTQALLFKWDTCHYEDCQIGNSTVYHEAANQAPLVIQTPARYSYFINCTMINYSSETTASCIDAPDANSVIWWVKFENCSLMSANLGDGATAGWTMAEAVTSVTTSGFLYFDNRCTSYNATIFAELDTSILNAAPAGAATAGGGEAVPGA